MKVFKKSGKPFKSGNKVNTVKGETRNEQDPKGRPAYTFFEDDSIVNTDQCSEAFKFGTKMKKNLLISEICKKFSKIRPNVWCGYLRADEIIVLLEAGAKETTEMYSTWAQTIKKNGDCRPAWFYFYPSKKLKGMVNPNFFNYKGGK